MNEMKSEAQDWAIRTYEVLPSKLTPEVRQALALRVDAVLRNTSNRRPVWAGIAHPVRAAKPWNQDGWE